LITTTKLNDNQIRLAIRYQFSYVLTIIPTYLQQMQRKNVRKLTVIYSITPDSNVNANVNDRWLTAKYLELQLIDFL